MAATADRAVPWIALALFGVATLGAGALVAGPARGLRSDIDEQQRDVAAQRGLVSRRLQVVEAQLATQREINDKTPRTPAASR